MSVSRNSDAEFFEADSVVIAIGMKCDNSLVKEAEGRVPSLYQAGACVEPGRVKQATEEGFRAALDV